MDLPLEIWAHIFDYLPYADLYRSRVVCRSWYDYILSSYKHFYYNIPGQVYLITTYPKYKQTFIMAIMAMFEEQNFNATLNKMLRHVKAPTPQYNTQQKLQKVTQGLLQFAPNVYTNKYHISMEKVGPLWLILQKHLRKFLPLSTLSLATNDMLDQFNNHLIQGLTNVKITEFPDMINLTHSSSDYEYLSGILIKIIWIFILLVKNEATLIKHVTTTATEESDHTGVPHDPSE